MSEKAPAAAADENHPTTTESTEKIRKEPPREFQSRLFRTATSRNTIVVAPTGCGKTRIAVMLIQHVLDELRRKGDFVKKVFFLVNKVILVRQQAQYTRRLLVSRDDNAALPASSEKGEEEEGELVDVDEDAARRRAIRSRSDTVGQYVGSMGVDSWSKSAWRAEFANHRVFVMTAQILLNCLSSAFIKMADIALLIFDECHHCIKKDPYNRIMQEFYFQRLLVTGGRDVPRILGLSASPYSFTTEDAGSAGFRQHRERLAVIQRNLNALAVVIEDDEVAKYCNFPELELVPYRVSSDRRKEDLWWEDLIQRWADTGERESSLWGSLDDRWERKAIAKGCKALRQFFNGLMEILFQLGSWSVWKYCSICLVDEVEMRAGYGADEYYAPRGRVDARRKEFLRRACKDIVDRSFRSKKVLSMKVRALSRTLRRRNDGPGITAGIVFAKRRIVARMLKEVVDHLGRSDRPGSLKGISAGFLVGHGQQTATRQAAMSHGVQRRAMESFGQEVNVLFATNVAEEGIDVQSCDIVVRFDMFEDLRSFIQSRGRARMKVSKYFIIHEKEDQRQQQVLDEIQACEKRMRLTCAQGVALSETSSGADDSPSFTFVAVLVVALTIGKFWNRTSADAKMGLAGAVSFVNNVCTLLPSDEFYRPTPEYFEDRVLLPPALRGIVPADDDAGFIHCPEKFVEVSSAKDIKRHCALEVVRRMHASGFVDDHFCPAIKKAQAEAFAAMRGATHGKKPPVRVWKFSPPAILRPSLEQGDRPLTLHVYGFSDVLEEASVERLGFVTMRRLMPESLLSSLPPIQSFRVRAPETEVSFSLSLLSEIPFDEDLWRRCRVFQSHLYGDVLGFRAPADLGKDYGPPEDRELAVVPIVSTGVAGFAIDLRLMEAVQQFFGEQIDRALTLRLRKGDVFRHKTKFCVVRDLCDGDPIRIKPEGVVKRLRHNRSKTPSDLPLMMVDQCQRVPISSELVRFAPTLSELLCLLEYELKWVSFCKALNLGLESRRWKHLRHLKAALTHPSHSRRNYQRAEFFGDALLKFVVGQHVFLKDAKREGFLTLQRCRLIGNGYLASLTDFSGVFGPGGENLVPVFDCFIRGQVPDRRKRGAPGFWVGRKKYVVGPKPMGDVVEAVTGVLYSLDTSFNLVYKWFDRLGYGVNSTCRHDRLSREEMDRFIANSFAPRQRWPPSEASSCCEEVWKKLGRDFRHPRLVLAAFTHPSFVSPHRPHVTCYERLEFLGMFFNLIFGLILEGDAVLDWYFTCHAMKRQKASLNEGQMSRFRSTYASNENLSRVLLKLDLAKLIFHSSHPLRELIALGNSSSSVAPPKIFADVFEALIGALHLDLISEHGHRSAWKKLTEILDQKAFLSLMQVESDSGYDEQTPRDRLRLATLRMEGYGDRPLLSESEYERDGLLVNRCSAFLRIGTKDIEIGSAEDVESKEAAMEGCQRDALDNLVKPLRQQPLAGCLQEESEQDSM